jgi:hypothetical protein
MITLTYIQGYRDGMLHRVVLDQGRSEPCVGNTHRKPLKVMAPVSSTVKSMSMGMSKSMVEQLLMSRFGVDISGLVVTGKECRVGKPPHIHFSLQSTTLTCRIISCRICLARG